MNISTQTQLFVQQASLVEAQIQYVEDYFNREKTCSHETITKYMENALTCLESFETEQRLVRSAVRSGFFADVYEAEMSLEETKTRYRKYKRSI